MRSPQDMKIIQIDVTNACQHACANCTRFCGHHRNTFFMDFDTYKKAVDSLEGYSGIVGMIGGEPTLHPEFDKFCAYLQEKRLHGRKTVLRDPIYDLERYIASGHLWNLKAKVGLWSSLTKGYYQHFESINDTFVTQLLNDHNNTCMHQALLMPRKELGIPDDEWIKKRDACWVQNTWSATITPKGAFFCEVAGSLDMLFDGPGGWKIEPGWWKRKPEEFGDQLRWCELCSACLDVPKRISNDERDDVTPGMFEKLKSIGSPKALQGHCVVHDPQDYEASNYHTFTSDNEYMETNDSKRTSRQNRNLFPKEIISCKFNELPNFYADATDFVLLADNAEERKDFRELFSSLILNPGCLYRYKGSLLFNKRASSLKNQTVDDALHLERLYPEDKIVDITDELLLRIIPEADTVRNIVEKYACSKDGDDK